MRRRQDQSCDERKNSARQHCPYAGHALNYEKMTSQAEEVIYMKYEAPQVEVVGSLHDLTQTVKFIEPQSDGFYLGVKGAGGVLPLGS
jgi:hypothetical protein